MTAMLAINAWDGAEEWRVVVPEGTDDVTLHGGAIEYRAQIKARHDPRRLFSSAELANYIVKSACTIPERDLRCGRVHIALVLERPAEGLSPTGWGKTLADNIDSSRTIEASLARAAEGLPLTADELLRATHLVVESEPLDACVTAICDRTGAIEAAARAAAHQLRHQVGELADRNFLAPAEAPEAINASIVQVTLDAMLGLVDPATVHAATSSGLCEPVTFEPTPDPNFYEGVDTTPGHVGAGLVMERPELSAPIVGGLEERRCVLVTGPSGCGKSAAAWLVANGTRHAVRWYRVRRLAPDQAHILVQLGHYLEASPERPVGFVIDDVGREMAGGWDALVGELAHEPGLVVLGTIREEDLFLVGSLNSAVLVRPLLDEPLAERIWSSLHSDRDVAFAHWREPFQLSQGLLLEYVHLLTSGRRLQETLDDQVRRRLKERRDEELLILQGVVSEARLGGAVDRERLRRRLNLSEPAFARALARLIDEHAIRIELVIGDCRRISANSKMAEREGCEV